MNAQQLVGWSDLPYEVAEQIICLCDNPSLLSLARLNKSLNLRAIQTFFSREDIDASKGITVKPAPYFDRVPLVITALNLCVHITTLPYFEYHFHPSGDPLLETEGITRLLHRISTVGDLSLYFEAPWSAWEFKRTSTWRLAFEMLLDTALKKGCRRLAMHGGNYFIILPPWPSRPSRSGPRTKASFVQCLMSHFKGPVGIWPLSHKASAISAPRTPSLACLELQSQMMLQPPLLPYTFKLLQYQSPVLRKLELVNLQVDPPTWEEFFSALSLPVLDEFTCGALTSHTPIITVKPHILLNFLTRHATIRKLVLLGVYIDGIETKFPSLEHAALFPSLTILDAHPQIISWLLQHKNSFPKLKCVSLTSEDSEDNGKNLDSAILALTSRCSSHTTTSSPELVHLRFTFYRHDRRLHSWLLKETDYPLTNPFLFLTRIEKLTVASWQFESYNGTRHSKLGLCDPNDLLAWFGLFQGLRDLTVREWGEEMEARMKKEFTATKLKSMCPLLERCIIGNSYIIG